MSLKDLSQEDFSFWKGYAKKMVDCHEKEFLQKNDPELMKAYYRGHNQKDESYNDAFTHDNQSGYENRREHFLTLSRIFQATNTILPGLYWQNPRPIVTPVRGTDHHSAALMAAVIRFYQKLNNDKKQNQEAIMSAWFFGLGWKKIGYRTVFFPKDDIKAEPESQMGVLDKVGATMKSVLGLKPDNLESKTSPDVVDYEGLFNDVAYPTDVMLDYKSDLANGKVILHRLKRSVYDLENFGDYDPQVVSDLYKKMSYQNGTRFHSREMEVTLNELHIQQRNGVWILTWVEEFSSKPLRYEKSTYQGKGFQFVPLYFTNEPGVRYPISHMKVATQVQEHVDYLATLMVRHVDRMRNQIAINKKALEPGQEKAIEYNEQGGIIWMNQAPVGHISNVSSPAVQTDLPSLMEVLQQNVTEIMGVDSQAVSGMSQNKTLGQDQIAQMGATMRSSGMLDKVEDWVIEQFKREGIILKEYSNAELNFQVTKKDYADPQTGKTQEEKWVEFMTPENPLGLKQYLQGEFDFDTDMEEAVRPNMQVKAQALTQLAEIAINPDFKMALLQNGKLIRLDKVIEELVDTMEVLGDPGVFMDDVDSMQAAAIMSQEVLMKNGGNVPQTPDQQMQQQLALAAMKGGGKPKEGGGSGGSPPADKGIPSAAKPNPVGASGGQK